MGNILEKPPARPAIFEELGLLVPPFHKLTSLVLGQVGSCSQSKKDKTSCIIPNASPEGNDIPPPPPPSIPFIASNIPLKLFSIALANDPIIAPTILSMKHDAAFTNLLIASFKKLPIISNNPPAKFLN